jgi:hypothetical protein
MYRILYLLKALLRKRRTVMAPLQKRAWLGLGLGVATSAAIIAVLVMKGATAFHEEEGTRYIVMALFLFGLFSWAVLLARVFHWPRREKRLFDERDEIIVRRALYVQLLAVIITMVIWSIALTEAYWSEGEIPIVFPNLMFFSIIVVNMLAQAAGILIGYWRMG